MVSTNLQDITGLKHLQHVCRPITLIARLTQISMKWRKTSCLGSMMASGSQGLRLTSCTAKKYVDRHPHEREEAKHKSYFGYIDDDEHNNHAQLPSQYFQPEGHFDSPHAALLRKREKNENIAQTKVWQYQHAESTPNRGAKLWKIGRKMLDGGKSKSALDTRNRNGKAYKKAFVTIDDKKIVTHSPKIFFQPHSRNEHRTLPKIQKDPGQRVESFKSFTRPVGHLYDHEGTYLSSHLARARSALTCLYPLIGVDASTIIVMCLVYRLTKKEAVWTNEAHSKTFFVQKFLLG